MRITSVIEHSGEPAIRITDAPTTEALYRTKIKAFCTGVTLEGFKSAIHDESGDIIGITRFFDVNEQVAYIAEPVRPDDIEAWFASPRSIPLLDYLASRNSEGPAPADNTPAEDQDHEQDHQDYEPEVETDVVQNEPELTTLQVQILQELKENGEGTVAELLDRLNMPGMQAAIRKNLHILMDEKHLISKRSSIQNGRPAQLWGVM